MKKSVIISILVVVILVGVLGYLHFFKETKYPGDSDIVKLNIATSYEKKLIQTGYVINGKLYKMLVVPKRGPLPILQISDELQNDVTDYILPYMGPRYDWYRENLSPKYFGYKSLTFELSDGNEYTFTNDSNMNINKIE